ncbi:hypothetical protein M5689_014599 [Euphorbia peplus]|nr:hypothetical protein M5689_014599 [Euphorbia peplus]
MEFHKHSILILLVVSSLLCSCSLSQATQTIGSAFFIDSRTNHYLRSPSPNDAVQSHSMSPLEVGAAVSVLLGFAPPATLSDAGSSKLNEILVPNPFHRPRAVFMLEITGVSDVTNSILTDALKRKVVAGSDKAEIELPAEGVSMVSLDEKLADVSDKKELSALASWLGGSYFSNSVESNDGEFIIPSADGEAGAGVNLLMSEKADRDFVTSLLALFYNSRSAIEMHEDLSHSTEGPAELIMGRFDGSKALKDQQRVELLLAAISKMVDSLQVAYKGQIVGVIFHNDISSPGAEPVLNVKLTTQSSRRWLDESTGSKAAEITLLRVALVRKTLAWLTGIILIISTLMGICLLLNMPVTRDTLLYSNVKLD